MARRRRTRLFKHEDVVIWAGFILGGIAFLCWIFVTAVAR